MPYVKPVVKDYGTLAELTGAQGLFGPEDGGSKAIPLHHVPAPSDPGGP